MARTKTAELKRSWLVQRLKKPVRMFGGDNPFSFGGGLHNGGLSSDAMDLLRGIFSFDYMGAAEFEWGAVPEALDRMAKSRTLATDTLAVQLSLVPPDWRLRKDAAAAAAVEGKEATVYLLASSEWMDEVKTRVLAWATEDVNRLHEQTRLSNALRPYHEWDADTRGWLELDNGFMFFTDAEMWRQAAALFGVEADVAVSA